MIRFTYDDLCNANHDWMCSCGPASLAVACDLTLEQVRPFFLPAFPGYTTPTRMFQALRNARREWRVLETAKSGSPVRLPTWGLARVQWHGPWTMSGANQRWAYVHTHWVAVSRLLNPHGAVADQNTVCIWDVNALGPPLNGDGWSPLQWWGSQVVPSIVRDIPRATGGWNFTHAIEVAR